MLPRYSSRSSSQIDLRSRLRRTIYNGSHTEFLTLPLSMSALTKLLDELKQASQDLDYEKARATLLTAVKEYVPQNGIDDLLWLRKAASGDISASNRVIDFPVRPK